MYIHTHGCDLFDTNLVINITQVTQDLLVLLDLQEAQVVPEFRVHQDRRVRKESSEIRDRLVRMLPALSVYVNMLSKDHRGCFC